MPGNGHRGRGFYRETDEKPHITKALIIRIISYFKPYPKLVLLMFIAIIITSILGVLPSVFTKNIIDIALPNENLRLLNNYDFFNICNTNYKWTDISWPKLFKYSYFKKHHTGFALWDVSTSAEYVSSVFFRR